MKIDYVNFVRNLVFLLSFIFIPVTKAQVTYSDTLNCAGGTPTFTVDLSSDSDSLWISDPAARAGSCCTPPDDNCVQFALTLAPDAVGIIFSVPDGCGAAPSGSLFYQVDCGPLTSVGTPLCLDGPGPFTITFCKPGNNENCYSIESITEPSVSDDITVADGCFDTLGVTGLEVPTISWTSIAPGGIGDYDSYLDCTSACDTVMVTPLAGYPPTVSYQVCGTSIGGCAGTPFCDTVTITIVPTLDVDISPLEPTICYGETGVDLTATPSGGEAPYAYLWSTGETTEIITVDSPGTYFVEINDATGCSVAYDTVTVTEYLVPITANAGPDIIVCQIPIPTVDLMGVVTGSTTGIWSGGTGSYDSSPTDLSLTYTPSAAELTDGYTELILTTTDNGSCPGDVDTVVVYFSTFSTLMDTIVTNVDCFGANTGSIDVLPSGGALPLTYIWDTGETTEDISGLSIGTYALIVTDVNGCIDSMAVTITQPPLLTTTLTTADVSCFAGTDGAIDFEVDGGVEPYSFLWTGGETSEDLSAIAAGSYSVTVTDGNGCTISASTAIVEPPQMIVDALTINDVLCFSGADGAADISVSGGVAPYTYLWSEGSTSEDLTSVIAGVYNVSITDANGCVLEESVTINEPSAITSVLDGTNVSCYGFTDGAVDLTVSGGTSPYVCLWSTGATTEDITALSNGIYTVNITDANGCIVTENITITQPPELTVSISGTDIICNGFATGVIDFNVSGGTPDYDYAWSTGDTTEDLLEVVAGTYTVEVTDLNGCLESSSITLTEPSPLILDVLVEDVSCTGLSDGNVDVTMSGGTPTYTYDWSTGSTSEDLNDVSAGIYSVSVEDDNGCIISANISVEEPIDFDAGRDSLKAFCNEEGTILDLNTFLTATTEGLWTENTSSGQFNTSTGIFNIGGLAEGEYVFTYTIPAFTPCTDTVAIFTITVNPIPEISFIGDNLSGCAPLKVNFDEFSSPAGMDCAWDFGDGSGMVECGSVMHTYEYPGTYDVSLEVVTDKGCSNYLSIENYINVIQGPEAAFTYNPDVPTIDDPMVFFENMSLFASSYTWNFGDGTAEEFVPDPEHLFPDAPNADYTITLIAENDIGCTDTAQQIIQIQDVVIFFVPNVFTPDGDDYNQEFKPVMTAGYDIYDYHLSIFNRWGELVFESYNAEYGWDGTYGSKGLVQDGVYVWVIEFGETMSDKRHKFTGHVSILK